MMEYWNVDFKGSFSFIYIPVKRVSPENPLLQFSINHYSITPVFHYSNFGV